jgi:hypothetical protein
MVAVHLCLDTFPCTDRLVAHDDSYGSPQNDDCSCDYELIDRYGAIIVCDKFPKVKCHFETYYFVVTHHR